MSAASSSSSTASFGMVTYTPSVESQDLPKLKTLYFSNEFPTDDLSTILRRLHKQSKHCSHSILARFLHEATRVLRNEVSQLRSELAQLVPAFESVTTLASETKLRKGPLSQSIDGVLLCVLQLGTYIGYVSHFLKFPFRCCARLIDKGTVSYIRRTRQSDPTV